MHLIGQLRLQGIKQQMKERAKGQDRQDLTRARGYGSQPDVRERVRHCAPYCQDWELRL